MMYSTFYRWTYERCRWIFPFFVFFCDCHCPWSHGPKWLWCFLVWQAIVKLQLYNCTLITKLSPNGTLEPHPPWRPVSLVVTEFMLISQQLIEFFPKFYLLRNSIPICYVCIFRVGRLARATSGFFYFFKPQRFTERVEDIYNREILLLFSNQYAASSSCCGVFPLALINMATISHDLWINPVGGRTQEPYSVFSFT